MDSVTDSSEQVAGGVAGALSQTAIYPLEIAKTRLALCDPPGRYSSALDCVRKVIAEEGFSALYKGLGTSTIGIIPYAAIDLGCNALLKEAVSARLENAAASSSTSTATTTGAVPSNP